MKTTNRTQFVLTVAAAALAAFILPAAAKETPVQLPKPDGKAPNTQKPVKVFILLGQSNMVGMGDIGLETNQGTLAFLTRKEGKYIARHDSEGFGWPSNFPSGRETRAEATLEGSLSPSDKAQAEGGRPGDLAGSCRAIYPWLIDEGGNWTVRKDVYYYDARTKKGCPLSPTSNNGRSIGPELGFGYVMGHVLDEPVLVLKSCIGNRSLGWNLLRPGSKRFTFEGRTYAGYKDTPDSWIEGQPKKEVNWYAGKQYDTDTANAKEVLKNLAQCYPDYKGQGYEVAGLVFWQGHKDQNLAHASRYEQNLVRFIQSLRKDFDAPNAPFVLATIAFGGWKLSGFGLTVANAQLAVSDPKKHLEFARNVKTVEARDLWRAADVSPNKRQGYHYHRNAETFLGVGHALGWAMAELLDRER